ncbi:MAG: hypothetical protein WC907_00820 [Acholeplasmataceae bacterium]
MKKGISLLMILFLSVLLVACGLPFSSKIVRNKKEIVNDKYGEVDYVIEDILVYKNLKDQFKNVEGIDYIEKNSGNRGSIEPELRQNLYIIIDIIKINNEYKLLVYNNIIKKFANEKKMFVLTDYFLPINMEDIEILSNEYLEEQSLTGYKVDFIKKDLNIKRPFHTTANDLSLSFYEKTSEGTIFMSLTDNLTGNVIVGNEYNLICSNVFKKEIYYPENTNYEDYINENYDTLNNDKVEFSLDKGDSYKEIDNKLETFDIWNEAINSEVPNAVFFYAFTYEEFLIKIDEAKNPNFYTYRYLTKEEFDALKEEYNEEYFEENILIFYYKYEPNISENYVYSITKLNNTLTVNINRFEGMQTALSSWLEIITIKKNDIKDITNINLIVRTISEKTTSVTVYIKDNYLRDFYIKDKTIDDFKGLSNLKQINLFRWSLNVDLIINQKISDEDLKSLINYLENNENVLSTGYKGKDFIRVQMKYSFYDKVFNKTLKINDFINEQSIIDDYSLTIKILNFTPIGSITFILEDKGKEQAKEMINELKELNYRFINYEGIY